MPPTMATPDARAAYRPFRHRRRRTRFHIWCLHAAAGCEHAPAIADKSHQPRRQDRHHPVQRQIRAVATASNITISRSQKPAGFCSCVTFRYDHGVAPSSVGREPSVSVPPRRGVTVLASPLHGGRNLPPVPRLSTSAAPSVQMPASSQQAQPGIRAPANACLAAASSSRRFRGLSPTPAKLPGPQVTSSDEKIRAIAARSSPR